MVQYNPFSPEVLSDPYPVYKRLRAEAPVYYIEEYDAWALSRFDDVWNASMDADHYTTTQGTTSAHVLTKVQPVTPMLNMMDPPEHTTLRSSVRRFLQPANVRRIEPEIREVVKSCFDEYLQKGEFDALRLVGLHRPIGVEEQNPHRAAERAAVVIAECPHGQVAHAVAVQIAQRRHRATEVIVIIQDSGEAALGVADLLVRLDRRVGVEEQDPHRAAAIAPVVTVGCPHG